MQGTHQLPADDYTVTASSPGVITLEGMTRHFKAQTTASRDNQQSIGGSELVFDKVGDQYFLHEILCPGTATMNVNIPESKQEKAVERETAGVRVVKQVMVAAK